MMIQGQEMYQGMKIGEILIRTGVINHFQLLTALRQQTRLNNRGERKYKLGEILLFGEILTISQLRRALSVQRPQTAKHRDKLLQMKEISKLTQALGQKSVKEVEPSSSGLKRLFGSQNFISKIFRIKGSA